MSNEFMFLLTTQKPTRANARKMQRICEEEGGYHFAEANVQEGEAPGINNGRYQGWFVGPNRGNPFDQRLRDAIKARIAAECGIQL